MSRPESVSSKMASVFEIAIWRISLALLLATGEPFVDRSAHEALVHLDECIFLGDLEEVHRVDLVEAALAAQRVECGAHEVEVSDAGDLDGVLEREEDPGRGASSGDIASRSSPSKRNLSGDVVGLVAGEHVSRGCSCRSRSAPSAPRPRQP